jgi:hypothetical protein
LSGLRYRMIGPIPVVVTGLNWTWPPDVDYLPCGKIESDGSVTWAKDPKSDQPIPFPAVIDVSIEVVESLAVTEFNRIDLDEYAIGDMRAAFGHEPGTPLPISEPPTVPPAEGATEPANVPTLPAPLSPVIEGMPVLPFGR